MKFVDLSGLPVACASTGEGGTEPVAHGGDLAAARRQFPDAPEPWVDLSTGINPHTYPLPALAPDAWSKLPQSEAEEALRVAAARRYGAADPAMIVIAAGSQPLIQAVPRLLAPTDVAILGPTYREHAAAWTRHGHAVSEVDSVALLRKRSVAVVVNPNNPTGRIVPPDELRQLAAMLVDRQGLLIVDEAFADLAPADTSIIESLPRATIVLRSFGKAYGLAGLRLGFAVAHVGVAERLRAEIGPWPVSGPALAIGTIALSDSRWLEMLRPALAADGARFDALITSCGLAIEGATPLFRLLSHPRAADIADALGSDGVLVRRFVERPNWLRIGLPSGEPAWMRLEQSMRRATT
ncbi:MAG: threonine-phosphate decarboxylase CobD [Hyphomicrobium sp.]